MTVVAEIEPQVMHAVGYAASLFVMLAVYVKRSCRGGITTSQGTSRRRRQMPSYWPMTIGLWLVRAMNAGDGVKDRGMLASAIADMAKAASA